MSYLLARVYQTEKRLQKLKRLAKGSNAAIWGNLIPVQEKLLADRVDRYRRAGITDEDYKKFVEDNWLNLTDVELEAERMEGCYHNMRWLQQTRPDDVMALMDHPCKDKRCYSCDKYRKATDEEESNYLHGRDMVTGEKLDANEDLT